MPAERLKRVRLRLNDGLCIRQRLERRSDVRPHDLVANRTHERKAFRMLRIVDKFSRERLAIHVTLEPTAIDVIEALGELFVLPSIFAYIRPGNGLEAANRMPNPWAHLCGVEIDLLRPGRPTGKTLIEALNACVPSALMRHRSCRWSMPAIASEKGGVGKIKISLTQHSAILR